MDCFTRDKLYRGKLDLNYGLKLQNTSEEVHMLAINLLERTVATMKGAAQPCRLPC